MGFRQPPSHSAHVTPLPSPISSPKQSRIVGAMRALISAIPVGVHHPGDAQSWRTSPPVESLWYVVEPVRFSSLARLFLFFPVLGQSEVAVWSNVREPRKHVELRGFEPLTPSMRTRCATGLRYSPRRGRPGCPGRLHGSRRTRCVRRSESPGSSGRMGPEVAVAEALARPTVFLDVLHTLYVHAAEVDGIHRV
jgi:hypothetical protein